jgi:hypothetical protein
MVIDVILTASVGAVAYLFGYTQHHTQLRKDCEQLREDYIRLYSLDNDTIAKLQENINYLEKQVAHRGTDK